VRLSRVRERERGERLGCLLTRSQALLAVAVLSSSGDRQLWGLRDSSLSLSLSLSVGVPAKKKGFGKSFYGLCHYNSLV
jgi:hypothetical protein